MKECNGSTSSSGKSKEKREMENGGEWTER